MYPYCFRGYDWVFGHLLAEKPSWANLTLYWHGKLPNPIYQECTRVISGTHNQILHTRFHNIWFDLLKYCLVYWTFTQTCRTQWECSHRALAEAHMRSMWIMLLWRKRKAFRREADPWCRAVLFGSINLMPVTKLLMMLSAKHSVSFWLTVRKKMQKRVSLSLLFKYAVDYYLNIYINTI